MTRTLSASFALAAAGALALGLAATPAAAQDRFGDGPYYGEPAAGQAPGENVEVTAPPYHHPARSTIGAPIVDVAMSRPVHFGDLDLTTRHGAHVLEARVRRTARELCRRMNFEYPVATPDSPPCYRTALEQAMPQADAAIREARYASNDRRGERDYDDYRD